MTSIPSAIRRNFWNNFKGLILKTEDFFCFLIEILKCAWNLEHFEKKDECHSLIISEIIFSERGCYSNV